MSLQSEQFAKNGLKKLLLLAGSGAFALSAAALLTYGYLQGKAYRQDRAQWVELQGLVTAKDYEGCRNQGESFSSRSRYYSEAQALLQRCDLGIARQQAADQKLPEAIATALSVSTPDESLKNEAQTLVAQWSGQLVSQGEQRLQAGDLDGAIATLRGIPETAPTASSVESTIQSWQKQWSQSETAIGQAKTLLAKGQWQAAKQELAGVTGIAHWQQQKKPLLEKAEAGIAEVARYEAEQARQRAIAAAPRYEYQAPQPASSGSGAPAAPPSPAPATAYAPPPQPSYNSTSFDQRVDNLYSRYVAEGQGDWDAWVQACQNAGGYVVDQGPNAGCQP